MVSSLFFFLKNKKLKLKKNPINKDTKIKELPKIINKLILSDRFYKDKFLNHLIDFPYTYYFLKNFKFNFEILYNYIFFNILNFLRKKNDLIDILFSIVVKKNIKLSHSLYNEYYSTMLLEKIIQKFIIITKKRKHKPIIIIFPQLMDLKNNKTNLLYTNFFILMKNKINVIDLTPHFKNKNLDKLFTNDKYGGHLSVFGNKFVSNIIKKKLNTIINNQS